MSLTNKYSPNWNSTFLRVNDNCEDWPVLTDAERRRKDLGEDTHCTPDSERKATLRRIGWIDQNGRVWINCPPPSQFDGGSLTPLLVDVRD